MSTFKVAFSMREHAIVIGSLPSGPSLRASRSTHDFALTMQYAQIHVAKVHSVICKIEEYLNPII
jgi:hypothetical protein